MKPNDYNVFIVIVLFHLRNPEEVCRALLPQGWRAPGSRGLAVGGAWPPAAVRAGPWGLQSYSRSYADAALSDPTLRGTGMDAKLSLSFYSQDLNVV